MAMSESRMKEICKAVAESARIHSVESCFSFSFEAPDLYGILPSSVSNQEWMDLLQYFHAFAVQSASGELGYKIYGERFEEFKKFAGLCDVELTRTQKWDKAAEITMDQPRFSSDNEAIAKCFAWLVSRVELKIHSDCEHFYIGVGNRSAMASGPRIADLLVDCVLDVHKE